MSAISYILRSALDFALPPRCAGCGVIVAADRQLCLACWETLDFLTATGCTLCGRPDVLDDLICANCLSNPPRHDGVRAAVAYGDLARSLVLRFKHGGRTGLARHLASAMSRLMPDEPCLIVPVPLHRWRIWQRGFNQSALLAKALGRATGQEVANNILLRNKATPLLRNLGAKARTDAVRGAFSVPPALRADLQGRSVVLIDDVFTSGATGNACAATLKRAGAAKVLIICWARVMHGD